ncbi:MAG: hypothetical protein AAGA42_22330 [Actinomycetota bacterium]
MATEVGGSGSLQAGVLLARNAGSANASRSALSMPGGSPAPRMAHQNAREMLAGGGGLLQATEIGGAFRQH